MGFENFGFTPEKNLQQEMDKSLEGVADSLSLLEAEERSLFLDLNDAANSYLKNGL